MEPVRLTDLLSATRGTARGFAGSAPPFDRISTDSRTIGPGEVFWALSGRNHDGHDHVPEAFARGALACVVNRSRSNQCDGSRIEVDDTLRALGDFAAWYRQQRETMVIGVTGSVGKTTTREMIYSVLSTRHAGTRSLRNFNNEVGLPLSLLELKNEHEFGVLEMGAGHVGDIRQLCRIASPEVGVVTTIGPAHLETFGTLEQIYEGKGELLEAIPVHGFAVIFGDDPQMSGLSRRAGCPVIRVGEQTGNDLTAEQVNFSQGRLRFVAGGDEYELAVPARHYLTAALFALAVAREIGLDPPAIREGFRRFTGESGRCQIHEVGEWTLIDDTYNANPLSMRAAFQCLRDWPTTGNRVLIAGDMLELGKESARCHEEIGASIVDAKIDRLLAFGNEAEHVADGALRAGMNPHAIADCHDLDALFTVLDCWLNPGDVILVKGSRGMRMERVVEWLKEHSGNKAIGKEIRPLARAVA